MASATTPTAQPRLDYAYLVIYTVSGINRAFFCTDLTILFLSRSPARGPLRQASGNASSPAKRLRREHGARLRRNSLAIQPFEFSQKRVMTVRTSFLQPRECLVLSVEASLGRKGTRALDRGVRGVRVPLLESHAHVRFRRRM